jgi:hypothetical protein
MARVAHVVVAVTEEVVSGIVGPDEAETWRGTVALEAVLPASVPVHVPKLTAAAMVTSRSAALTRRSDRGEILTSGRRC